MDITRELADYVVKLRFEDLPEDVVEAAKKVILDTVGSTLAGTTAPGIETLHTLVTEWGGRPESSLLAFGNKVPAPSAVLVNATAARALFFSASLRVTASSTSGVSHWTV